MILQNLPPHHIDSSFKYCYRCNIEDSELLASVKEKGVLQPVWLAGEKARLILDGHRRVFAARRLNVSSVPVILFPLDNIEEVFLCAVHLNGTGTGLSTMEKLRAVSIAGRLWSAKCKEQTEAALGITRIPHLDKTLDRVTGMPDWVQNYFHRINLKMRMVERLSTYPLPEYQPWFEMADSFSIKGAELAGILEQVRDICLRDIIGAEKLWNSLSGEKLMAGKMTPQQKVREIKKRLGERRFPLYSAIQKNIRTAVRDVEKGFSGNLQINWDPSLEQPGIGLNLWITDSQQLTQIGQKFQEQTVKAKITKLLEDMNRLPEEAS